jgi:hypothetical protein
VNDALSTAVANDTDNARPPRDPSVVLEDLVVTVNDLRRDMLRIGDAARGGWPGINDMAIYEEVRGLLERRGISPMSVSIEEIDWNGRISLEVLIDGPASEDISRRAKSVLERVPKYAAQLIWSESLRPTVTTNRGGSRVVTPSIHQNEPESDENLF